MRELDVRTLIRRDPQEPQEGSRMIHIDNPAQVGRLMRKLRTDAGLSQSDVIASSGLTRTQIWEAETEAHLPRLTTLVRFVRALGYDLVLMPREDDEPPCGREHPSDDDDVTSETSDSEGWGKPKRRIRSCVEAWPGCETGAYDPRCCRFPKSCSATVYDPATVADDELEAE